MKRKSPNKAPPGQRQLRVGERIRHLLVEVLRRGELYDPVLASANLITVTAVEIGPDLKHATAYIMPLGGKNAEEITEALNKASGYFRSEIGHDLDMRYTPKISFRIDHSFEQMDHINKLLMQDTVQRDLSRKNDENEE